MQDPEFRKQVEEARKKEVQRREEERIRAEEERQRMRIRAKEEKRRIEEEKRRIEEEKLKKEINDTTQRVNASLQYQGLSDPICENMAALILDFTCSMLLGSEHNLNEFFGSEEEAEDLREKLSPECRKTSQTIRKELMELKITQDPVFGLITVNRLKDYLPDENILSEEDYNNIADHAKFGCVKLIKNSNFDNFDDDEKFAITELISIIENSDGLDFGDDYDKKLIALIEKINERSSSEIPQKSRTKTFIPPVKVKYQQRNKTRDIERE